ncbi:MAG: hypothetical protein IH965_06705 [Gemmatimonadetes bacterium]|nr:hypothetical protein [Gemmatimonadota bacterium]
MREPADTGTTGGIPVLTPLWRALSHERHAGWVRPLASAVVPGTGQMLGHNERGALYLIAEALLLTRFIAFNNEGRRERERFQNLAFVVARGPFAPTRPDTTFEYFEQMGKFKESGPFDTDDGPAFVPPDDELTFNGSIWALAKQTFFADPDNPPDPDSPEFQRALAFYTGRAIGPNFQWSWRNAGLEQDLFRQTIRESDEAFRRSVQQLGLLLANHVLSAVDAFISHRLSAPDRPIQIHGYVVPRGPGSRRLELTVWLTAWF